MPKLTINGKEVEFEKGMSVLQVAESAGVEIPRFCYHKRLKVAGNCRMCLVYIEGGPPKPTASCAFPAGDGMVVHTNSPMVKKAREGVLEFQLINHPLDCPVCDQGGECDLQDLAVAYGKGESRFSECKHTVDDKEYGPLIKTSMTRCIHCTRCIRFMTDIAGVEMLGGVFRGESMEITNFIKKGINSELSGNIIDVCPVGALNSRPYSFKARSWELTHTDSIDVLDAVGSNIVIDTRNDEVMRIRPRENDDVNEEWISDKARFSYDGLKTQRLDRPYVKRKGKFVAVSWDEALSTIVDKIREINDGNKLAAIAGDLADAEAMTVLKDIMTSLGSNNIDCRQDGMVITREDPYLFNTTIAGIDNADACLLIGADPRHEAPIVNARLRKRFIKGGFSVASIGADVDLTYDVDNLGNDPEILKEIASGKHEFSKALKEASNPMIIIGAAALARDDTLAILNIISDICKTFHVITSEWNGVNVLHTAASRVAGLELGFLPSDEGKDIVEIVEGAKTGDIELVYLLGADELDMIAFKNTFVVYQGHHGDKGAHNADVILPAAAYTEKCATYVNMEGRVQRTTAVSTPPNDALRDWNVLTKLLKKLELNLPYDSLQQVRDRIVEVSANLEKDLISTTHDKFGKKGKLIKKPFAKTVENFYMTDPITRASKVMAECTTAFSKTKNKKAA